MLPEHGCHGTIAKMLANCALLNLGWSYDESQMSEVQASDKTKSSRVFDGAYARHSRRKGALSGLSDCAQQGILTVPSALRKSDPLVLARSNPGQEQHWERWGATTPYRTEKLLRTRYRCHARQPSDEGNPDPNSLCSNRSDESLETKTANDLIGQL